MKYLFIKETGSYIPEPENYKDVLELIKSDYFRMVGRKDSLIKMFLYTFYEPSFKFMFWHRISAFKRKNPLWFISKLLHRRYMFKYGIMIASSTKIGYGLFLGHPNGIIINHTAIIGNNVNLSHFTTIGSNLKGAAIIGDNVYIGPSCSLIERVVIAKNALIGAGSIVTKDVEENSTTVGNPARKIGERKYDFINNKWIFKGDKGI